MNTKVEIQVLSKADGRTWNPVKDQPAFADMAQARRWLQIRNQNHRARNQYQFVKVA